MNAVLGAVADPTRRAILARLSRGEATVTELAEPFDMSMPAISKHLKVLERAGLISRGREAQWRPCRLETGPLREVDGWLEKYRRLWEGSFDRMDAYLKEISDAEITAKDFRTWNATVLMAATLAETPPPKSRTARKKAIRQAAVNGSTSLYNAVYVALRAFHKVAEDGRVRRRAIVVLHALPRVWGEPLPPRRPPILVELPRPGDPVR